MQATRHRAPARANGSNGNGNGHNGHHRAAIRREVPPAARRGDRPPPVAAVPAELEPHPYSQLLPEMSEADYAALREDIRRNRVRNRGMLLDGKILDGRHRYRVARELGVPIDFDTFDPAVHGDPVAYVLSQATGRHLTNDQKPFVAVRFLGLYEAAAKGRQREHGQTAPGRPNTGGKFATSDPPTPPNTGGKSATGVPATTYADARFELHNSRLPLVMKLYRREVGPPPTGATKDELIVPILNKRFGGPAVAAAREARRRELLATPFAELERRHPLTYSVLDSKEKAVERILEKLYGPAPQPPAPPAPAAKAKARDQAAEFFGCSARSIQDAKFVLEHAPDLFELGFAGRSRGPDGKVRSGINVSRALREYKRREKLKSLVARSDAARKAHHDLGGGWEVVCGDAIEELDGIDPRPRLYFTDPRYNLGLDYGQGERADRTTEHEYLTWCEKWIKLLAETVAADGSVFVMIDALHQADFLLYGKAAGLTWRNTIVWHETFGNYTAENFTPCARFIHYFTKHKTRFVWNADDILVPSDRQAVYNDARAVGSGKVPGNVWEVPRLVDNSPERMPGFPTQLPLQLVERIVRVASDPGDLVADPFNGTGTTGHAAIKLGRRYLGIDVVEKNVEWSRHRLTGVAAEVAR